MAVSGVLGARDGMGYIILFKISLEMQSEPLMMLKPRSHAIEMVFVLIATGHAGSSARSFMLS